jgi:hypothetical protein
MAWTVDVDGTDITSICQSIQWRPKLNRPASCVVRYPAHLFQVTTGQSELHLYDGATLMFSGPVWFQQASGTPNSAYTEVTAYDHLIYLSKRLCKKPGTSQAGNLITPGSVITDNQTGPAILEAFINYSKTIDDAANPTAPPLPLTVVSAALGGDDLSGTPQNFPMTIEQMRALLCSTGQLNVLVTPGVGSSTLDLTNGGVVNDLSGSVSIQYQTGAYNSQVAEYTEDMEDVINALWYLLGPRGPRMGRRVWIPKNHWAGSITPTGPNSGGDGEGPLVGPGWPVDLEDRFMDSRDAYGYMQEIRIFDDQDDEEDARPMFEEEWANEAWIRATEKQLVNIKPQRGTPPAFGVGDLISVAAGTRLGGAFSGTQVVFEFEVTIDTDGVVEVSDIITSGEQS